MRILFDKNVAVPLRRFLPGHDVGRSDRLHGRPRKWRLAGHRQESGFDVIVTSDQNLAYQQNLNGRKIALVVLGAGNWPTFCTNIAEIAAAVEAATPNSYVFIEMPLEGVNQSFEPGFIARGKPLGQATSLSEID